MGHASGRGTRQRANVHGMWPLASFVLKTAWDTLKRFPAPLSAAAVAGALLIEVEHRNYRGQDPLMFVLAAGLGIPLGTALTLLAERPPRWLARLPARAPLAFLVTLAVVLGYGLVLAGARGQGEGYILRYAQLSLAAHLAVSIAPFLARGAVESGPDPEQRTRAVWQLGRQLFLRLPLSAVYAVVVFGGLALALAAVVHLFDLEVSEDRYFELWVVCTFILQTWHFLAGIPRDFEALTEDHSYPRGLRIFAQFVLLPLLGLYLLILYAYGAKISLTATLPSGWVGWMVSAAGGFGMLALLLLFPARQGASGRFVRAVETTFHVAILPLLGLLFVSLAVRMDAYGFTERRYFLLVLGVWLGVASIYRLRWGRRTLIWIPASLALVALATSRGPRSALAVSRNSQSARLTALLGKHERVQGPAVAAAGVPFEDEREMSRILDYLVETHGKASLRRWPTLQGTPETAADFMRARGLGYVERYATSGEVLDFYGKIDGPLQVHGYDWLVQFEVYDHSNAPPATGRFQLRLGEEGAAIHVHDSGSRRSRISLAPVLERLRREHPRGKGDIEPIYVESESGGLRLKLVLTHLRAERRADGWAVMNCGGSLLIGE